MPTQIQLKTVKTVEIEPESAVPRRTIRSLVDGRCAVDDNSSCIDTGSRHPAPTDAVAREIAMTRKAASVRWRSTTPCEVAMITLMVTMIPSTTRVAPVFSASVQPLWSQSTPPAISPRAVPESPYSVSQRVWRSPWAPPNVVVWFVAMNIRTMSSSRGRSNK